MDNKILEILLDMQQDLKGVKDEIKGINKRLDVIEFKMEDGFETLELLSRENSREINILKVKVAEVEDRIKEMNNPN